MIGAYLLRYFCVFRQKGHGCKRWKIFCVILVTTLFLITRFYSMNYSAPGFSGSIDKKMPATRPAKWIIVTSIFYPTEQIRRLSQIPGWRLLVVADQKTPTNWSLGTTATFLNTTLQEELGYNVFKLLPWNAYTRKMIGYLYAIENGAKFIYDTDDDNAPDDPSTFEQNYVLTKKTRGLITQNDSYAVNPYMHFGQPTVWPRGYPLDEINQNSSNVYTVCQMETPLIQQGLVNGDPDVDAIFRLTRKRRSRLNISFDGRAPPIIYPPTVLAPFNSQNTLFHYKAFWTLFLPISVTFRVTDIWRGYWAQPLIWKIGGRLGFYPPHTTQIRNSHVYLKDFGEEDKLYKQSGDLVLFLSNWNCSQATLYPCMLELTEAMANLNFWSLTEVELMRAWISDLKNVGYKEPAFRNYTACLKGKDKSEVVFHPADIEVSPVKSERTGLHKFCNLTLPTIETPLIRFPSTLLIVTFNFQWYQNIWLLDLIYRPHYPNIVYCGDLALSDFGVLRTLMASKEFVAEGVKRFTFIRTLKIQQGSFLYECALRAIDMKFSVSGYVVVGDDVLLNYWSTVTLNPNEMWIQNTINYRNLDELLNLHEPGVASWQGWRFIEPALKGRAKIQKSNNSLIKKFRSDRENYGLNWSMIGFTDSDLFYLPISKQEIYYEVGTLLWKAGVALDFATSLLVDGLSSPGNIVQLPGAVLWGADRSRPFDHFRASETHLHPVKLRDLMADAGLMQEYCSKYISRILRPPKFKNLTQNVRRSVTPDLSNEAI